MALLAPGTTVARYTILGRLATGGMAEVYLARQSGPSGFSKTLVLKVILPQLADDPQFVQMFQNEAKLAALINHPNVVQIFDFGVEDGLHYMAMEYIDGRNLHRIVRALDDSKQAMPLPIAVRIAADAASALDHAHSLADASGVPLQIIHRDVSLENILCTYTGQVKLVDFGIAKARTLESYTSQGTLKGKYNYMAPELIDGLPIDHRIDIYALGVVLYRLVTGQLPFTGENHAQILHRIVSWMPTAPRELRSEVPELLERIIMRALAKDRERRYQRAGELQADLENFLQACGAAVMAYQLRLFMAVLFPPGTDEDREAYHQLAGTPSAPSRPSLASIPGLTPGGAARSGRMSATTGPRRPGLVSRPSAAPPTAATEAWSASQPRAGTSGARSLPTPLPVGPPRPPPTAALPAEQPAADAPVPPPPTEAGETVASLAETLLAVDTGQPQGPDSDETMVYEPPPIACPAQPPPGMPQIPTDTMERVLASCMVASPRTEEHAPARITPRTEPDLSAHPWRADPAESAGQMGEALDRLPRFPRGRALLIAGSAVLFLILAGGTYLVMRHLRGVGARSPKLDVRPAHLPPRPIEPVLEPDRSPLRDAMAVPAHTPDKGTPAPDVTAGPEASTPVLPLGPGLLSVQSLGPAEVMVNGRRVGGVPVERHPLPAGTYRVTVRSSTHHFVVSRVVTVQPGRGLDLKLVPRRGQIRVLVRPWAVVTLDGKRLGTTPLPPSSVYEGPHLLELENQNLGVKKSLRVVVRANKEEVVKVQLERGTR